jgi:hypothetical protein
VQLLLGFVPLLGQSLDLLLLIHVFTLKGLQGLLQLGKHYVPALGGLLRLLSGTLQ